MMIADEEACESGSFYREGNERDGRCKPLRAA